MITEPATGKASLSADARTLTITTNARRGKKVVPHVVTYTVERLQPDIRVANPAVRLTKEDGEFYDVAVVGGYPSCTCPHATFRGGNSRVVCKHVLGCRAVNLLPKEHAYGKRN